MFTFNYSKSNMALFICKFGYIFVCILRLLLFWMIIFVCHFVPPCELCVSACASYFVHLSTSLNLTFHIQREI